MLFDGDDPLNVGDVSSRRFLAENVQTMLEAGDGRFRSQVVRQADEQHVEVVLEEVLIGHMAICAVRVSTGGIEANVADRFGT